MLCYSLMRSEGARDGARTSYWRPTVLLYTESVTCPSQNTPSDFSSVESEQERREGTQTPRVSEESLHKYGMHTLTAVHSALVSRFGSCGRGLM